MIETIGINGGGQLGRMLSQEAIRLGFKVVVADPTPNCPAAQVGARQIQAPITEYDTLQALSEQSDVVTFEIEHFPAVHLEALESRGIDIQPAAAALSTIQDKLHQKEWLHRSGVPVAPFGETFNDPALAGGGPYIVKLRKGGYDGRGNLVVDAKEMGADSAGSMPGYIERTFSGQPTYVEQVVPFNKELAVIAARDRNGKVACYPVVETVHENNICHTVIAPADINPQTRLNALDLAHTVMKGLPGAGVFAIEMFASDDDVMVNEIAPRVHNSGHWTDRGSMTSQFEQHIRAITGMPLGPTTMQTEAAAMINILGGQDRRLSREGLDQVLAMAGVYPHFYGKDERPARKIGHITVLGNGANQVRSIASLARSMLHV